MFGKAPYNLSKSQYEKDIKKNKIKVNISLISFIREIPNFYDKKI